MAPAAPEPPASEQLREEAADWFARMRGPDAERIRGELDAWLAADSAHRAAYRRIQMSWEQTRLVGLTPSGEARAGLPPLRRRYVSPQFAIAASVALILAVGALLLVRPGWRAPPATTGVELASRVGEIREVRLADGSVVTLDSDTRLEVAFGANERRLRLLAGRARFAVAHDAARPFVVAAGDGEVVATGTLFDVSLVGGRPRVRLIEGSVVVRRAVHGAAPVAVARLAPGQTVEMGSPQAAPSPAPAGDDRWVSGTLTFDGAPLADVVAEANRYSKRKIRLGDPSLATLRVTGGFKVGKPESVAAALAASFGLEVHTDADGTLVLERR